MSHLDDESIASLAIGDDHDATAALHAAECGECSARVEHMRALADRMGTLGRHSGLLTPPDRVWEQIASELGDELLAETSVSAAVAPSTPALRAATESRDVADTMSEATSPAVTDAPDVSVARRAADLSGAPEAASPSPVDLASARRARDAQRDESRGDGNRARGSRRTPWLVGVAAGIVGLVAGAGIVAGVLRGGEPSGEVVAQAALTNLVTDAEAGTARVEVLSDGREVLVLDTDFEDVPGGYLEVWLIDPNIEGMVSLGHLTQGSEEFVIPYGFDVAAFPIVDISVEPLDGVPTHSGDSVTRGVLEQ